MVIKNWNPGNKMDVAGILTTCWFLQCNPKSNSSAFCLRLQGSGHSQKPKHSYPGLIKQGLDSGPPPGEGVGCTKISSIRPLPRRGVGGEGLLIIEPPSSVPFKPCPYTGFGRYPAPGRMKPVSYPLSSESSPGCCRPFVQPYTLCR